MPKKRLSLLAHDNNNMYVHMTKVRQANKFPTFLIFAACQGVQLTTVGDKRWQFG